MHPLNGLFAIVLLFAPAEDREAERLSRAKALVEALQKKDFAAAGKHFDPTMKKVMPADKTETFWKELIGQVGAWQKILGSEASTAGKLGVVQTTVKFEKAELVFRIVFDSEDRIQGFFIQQPKPKTFPPPPYAKPDSFREESVTIGEGGDWPLPGTLALPRGKGPYPAVVLLHGSGPNDRDETILGNKPLRDLAWGLASQGIAVLRFDKRTRVHGAKMKDPTLKEEVFDDALAAISLARKHKDIDPDRVFVLGHSLGAMAAPRVGELDAKLRGLIMMAGNSRPLEDLVIEQIRYIYSLDGGPTKEQKEKLDALEKQVAKVKDSTLSSDTPSKELPLGLPAKYWLALKAYDQKGTAAKLTMPLLILQGERDYQVTMDDFAGWKKALAARKNATFKNYPDLNHLFMAGKEKGKSKPSEYSRQSHVAQEVVEDVAAWVKKQSVEE